MVHGWFLGKVTGLSRAQLTRLVGQYRGAGRIEDRRRGPARPFERPADVRQLAEADETLGDLCGAAAAAVNAARAERFRAISRPGAGRVIRSDVAPERWRG